MCVLVWLKKARVSLNILIFFSKHVFSCHNYTYNNSNYNVYKEIFYKKSTRHPFQGFYVGVL
jgi:hypothetical protein